MFNLSSMRSRSKSKRKFKSKTKKQRGKSRRRMSAGQSKWIKEAISVHQKMRQSDPSATYGDALREASRRRKR